MTQTNLRRTPRDPDPAPEPKPPTRAELLARLEQQEARVGLVQAEHARLDKLASTAQAKVNDKWRELHKARRAMQETAEKIRETLPAPPPASENHLDLDGA